MKVFRKAKAAGWGVGFFYKFWAEGKNKKEGGVENFNNVSRPASERDHLSDNYSTIRTFSTFTGSGISFCSSMIVSVCSQAGTSMVPMTVSGIG